MTQANRASRTSSNDSSGRESWVSSDTVRAGPIFGTTRGTSMHIETEKQRKQFENDSQISPGSGAVDAAWPGAAEPSAHGSPSLRALENHRLDLAVLAHGDHGRPSIQRIPPSAIDSPPSMTWPLPHDPPAKPPGSFAGSFFDDSTESGPPSPPRPLPSPSRLGPNHSPDSAFFLDERRPSQTSVTTVSSQGSGRSIPSRRSQRKLQGFFGDDFPGREGSFTSDGILPPTGNGPPSLHANGSSWADRSPLALSRKRTNSMTNASFSEPRTASPTSRPHTPVPPSDVTPWLYQDSKDIPLYGDAPVRQVLSGRDKQRYAENDRASLSAASSTTSSHHSQQLPHPHHPHKLHFPGHRRLKSKEDGALPTTRDLTRDHATRPLPARREDSGTSTSSRRFPDTLSSSSSTSTAKYPLPPTSPTPSSYTGMSRDSLATQKSPIGATKRSLFDKFTKRGRHRDEHDALKHLPPSTKSLQDSLKGVKMAKVDSTPLGIGIGLGLGRSKDQSGGTALENGYGARDYNGIDHASHRKLHLGHGKPKGAKRGSASDPSGGKEASAERNGSVESQSTFHLDTDLTRMDGIISQPPPMTPPDGGIFTGLTPGDEPVKVVAESLEDPSGAAGGADWNAPDSWAVNKVADENMTRLREIDDAGVPPRELDLSTPFCLRIFRVDSTFATLSTNLNSTVEELLRQLGKKSFLQDNLANYQIVMRKHDLQRVLQRGERPIVIQKRFLEQAGYTETDRIDEIGREDNSYLCRFTFVPKFYTDEKDHNLGKMQKFSHVNLSGRNLSAIPIALYQKSTEIISLNLSRNLSINVPKDFIQGCINLREIKYTGNEAWQLPPSLGHATRLTYLDISHNRLERIEHAGLDKLQSLLSIKLANNMISAIPSFFTQFKYLRNLNISSNCLEAFPDFLCELTSLVDLDISFNSIACLPQKIGHLASLERLLATNNRLSGAFPDTFGCLLSLKEVDVRHNRLSNIDVVYQLPSLEQFMAGYNSISVFEGSFTRIRTLQLNNNPVTRFDITLPVPSLTTLTLSSAKLAQLQDDLFEKIPNLEKLILDKNHFVTLTPQIGQLRRLEHLSLAKNLLSSLPAEIGCLQSLRFFDVRENNLKKLPAEIWCCLRLDTLNVSTNVLEEFPKPGATPPAVPGESPRVHPSAASAYAPPTTTTPALSSSPSFEELGDLRSVGTRRPSQASGNLLGIGSTPTSSQRKGSLVSVYGPGGRKASVVSRQLSEGTATPTSTTRKDSSFSARVHTTFAGALRHLYLADNRLNDEVFDEIAMLPELRLLNLSYNELYDIPQHSLTRWPHLAELYLSGNELTSLPADDFQSQSQLQVLHLNGNKFQVLPAELGKVDKLAVLDCGSNALKYNVSNWPYDWNWNYNHNLKYLNLSGNKKLEIKPTTSYGNDREKEDLTNFTSLHHLRVLGLMDVTLMVPSIPDQTEDRRVRTSGSLAGSMTYGMADTLGRNEHLSTIDMVVPKFGGHEAETLLGMFDGEALSSGGSKVARFLHENFGAHLTEEMSRLQTDRETPVDALRRTFLNLNKDLASSAGQVQEANARHLAHRGSVSNTVLTPDDLHSGGVATVMFLQRMELYVANVGDAQAVLIQSEGSHRIITCKHDPTRPDERQRIRDAGGYVSRHGKLNDVLDVSRAFGYVQLMPAVQAAPHIAQISLKEQDEMILIASKELWEYLTPDVVVDVARSERGDLMRAAQKLRDLAMAFGATGKIMIMILGVSDLKKRERNRYRAQSLSMGPSGLSDEPFFPIKRGKRKQDGVDDSNLSRLDQEIEAPTGEVSMVFTDIKNSTLLWETYPLSMRSAIKMHNQVMRRQLRIVGGYEVKTEGDAFMVSFPTATSALLWCFSVQTHLLDIAWPSEVLNSVHGQEVLDADGQVIYRGLSVRMGIHWGVPVCEPDPITRRMDYFGPMVNRASRISSVADGGQITASSDFIGEIHRALETYQESDRSYSTGSEDTLNDDVLGQAIRRELNSLGLLGFEVKELGERRLKGLENPEYISLVYPHSLAGRVIAQQQRADAEAAQAANSPATLSKESQLTIDTEAVWQLWNLTLRLEMLCSTLEDPQSSQLKAPETAVLERMKNRGGEVTDRFLLNLVEHQVSRVETCSTALYMRHLDTPFQSVRSLLDLAKPMGEVHRRLDDKMAHLKEIQQKEAKLRSIAAQLGIDLKDL
ncbi:MAG: cysteinyl-tRNA synthetase [Thelocarpon superellum]|nr:MAG: cysteinyl-tRNA synthetase [Thelocarpon superellum]